ncbi:hypothetical protein VIBNISOn1_p0064 [Vibrio nigripulchritudo SOn1]|uniref:Uncharacterized protein n=1 Tax=Vibrio nigripulchritudo SOn1 TaxID=1238450 RepID=A0AAV2W0W3_9VIBR|nr:hypothetical protein VIBNISOn1_p0064 [Vibrio nigripulchritudo SOn1]
MIQVPMSENSSFTSQKPSACAAECLARVSNSSDPLMISLVLLAQRWNFLNDQVKSLDNTLKKLTLNTAQSVVSRFGSAQMWLQRS